MPIISNKIPLHIVLLYTKNIMIYVINKFTTGDAKNIYLEYNLFLHNFI